jgi:hypothetical protein
MGKTAKKQLAAMTAALLGVLAFPATAAAEQNSKSSLVRKFKRNSQAWS